MRTRMRGGGEEWPGSESAILSARGAPSQQEEHPHSTSSSCNTSAAAGRASGSASKHRRTSAAIWAGHSSGARSSRSSPRTGGSPVHSSQTTTPARCSGRACGRGEPRQGTPGLQPGPAARTANAPKYQGGVQAGAGGGGCAPYEYMSTFSLHLAPERTSGALQGARNDRVSAARLGRRHGAGLGWCGRRPRQPRPGAADRPGGGSPPGERA